MLNIIYTYTNETVTEASMLVTRNRKCTIYLSLSIVRRISWWTIIIYLRSPDGAIFSILSTCRLQPQAAAAAAAHSTSPCDLDLWPFDLIFWVRLAAVMDYICIDFGADSSSRFPLRVQTHRHTDRHTSMQLITIPKLDYGRCELEIYITRHMY